MTGLRVKHCKQKGLLPLMAALALCAPALPAHAQSAGDFRLQPGKSAPRAQGPVDPENPASTPTVAASSPAPPPSPVPAVPVPTAAPSAEAAPAPRPRPAATAARPAAAPTPSAAATPAPASAPRPLPSPTPSLNTAPPVAAPIPAAAEPAPQAAEPESGIPWWWLIPAALIGAVVAAWLLRRRSDAAAVPEIERPRAVSEPQPEPEPEGSPAPESPLALHLEPERLSVSLVNATLHYRLTLTNRTAQPLGPIAVAADMIGAHASLAVESQLARDGAGLELRHEVPVLAPGASADLRGELRLPLSEVTPIRAGAATLLVPLVRLRIEAPGLARTTAIVVGETPAVAGAPLRPFRLDPGPRIFGAVSQREIAAAA